MVCKHEWSPLPQLSSTGKPTGSGECLRCGTRYHTVPTVGSNTAWFITGGGNEMMAPLPEEFPGMVRFLLEK